MGCEIVGPKNIWLIRGFQNCSEVLLTVVVGGQVICLFLGQPYPPEGKCLRIYGLRFDQKKDQIDPGLC